MGTLRRTGALGAGVALLVLLAGRDAPAASFEKKAFDPKAPAQKVFEWKSKAGTTCLWRAPERYDATKGANVTLILHGSNLTREWGFANHSAKTFRPQDFVVSPDGTTPNGKGGFNFLKEDSKKVHALVEEVRAALKVRGVFLYGHSQGSFFALQYAGDFPDDVNGVVAHASGLWTWTQHGKKCHHQAVVFVHGTQDPVVPYGQSVGGFQALADAGYPMARLRSLEFWNHWPAEHNGDVPHTSQQLAWVEGMTTDDPDRLAACFDLLATPKNDGIAEHDFAGAWSLAGHVASSEVASESLKARAADTKSKVEALAAAHVEEMRVPDDVELASEPWVGHLPIFLRAFPGVPAREDLAKRLAPVLDAHQKAAVANLREYYRALESKKVPAAFAAGTEAIAKGFLWHECWDSTLRENLASWRKDAAKHKLGKPALKAYDAGPRNLSDAITAGWKSFEKVNRTYRSD
jgi:predicted esterase